jgi:putative PIN family toxin of toxin-antitoxin system
MMDGQPRINDSLPLLKFVIDSNIWIEAYSNKTSKKRADYVKEAINIASSSGIIIYTEDTKNDLKYALHKKVNNDEIKEEIASIIWDKFLQRSFSVKNKTPQKEYEEENHAELSKCKDKDDWVFLALADEHEAPYIITNDDHLLSMKKYKNVEIATPGTFKLATLPLHRQPDKRVRNQRESGQRR